ncbi:MAG: hypothetical protein AAGA75_24460 [Cyanobacteria bacterium P01_E01_bin.6]
MALTTAERVGLAQSQTWLEFIWMSVVNHATGVMLTITDPSSITAAQKLAQKYRTQASNKNASIFISAATWIASRVDSPEFLGTEITAESIRQGIENGTLDAAIATIISTSWPLIAAISEQEDQ